MNTRTSALSLSGIACAAALAACSSAGAGVDEPIGRRRPLDDSCEPAKGNNCSTTRSPAPTGARARTCHVEGDHFVLTPQHVQALYQTNPNDPLFNVIDADDPTAATLTFDHLKAGLVRVTLTLADNLDVIDAEGNVITNADRTISVWRGVPTTNNTSYTAPYQYDGRAATLEIQADGALHAHSQINYEPSPETLHEIADFERSRFTDPAAEVVADLVDSRRDPAGLCCRTSPPTRSSGPARRSSRTSAPSATARAPST